jgi:hypothetical protein
MELKNHLNEKFELRIFGNQNYIKNETINWWFRSCIIITEKGKKRKTHLKLLTREDLYLLHDWLKQVYSGNYTQTVFEFVDAHVWFSIWKRGRERILRFFIQGDKYRKFYWDWRIKNDADNKLLSYIETIKNAY